MYRMAAAIAPYSRPEFVPRTAMHQGALALIDVEEGAATVADSAATWPTERKTAQDGHP